MHSTKNGKFPGCPAAQHSAGEGGGSGGSVSEMQREGEVHRGVKGPSPGRSPPTVCGTVNIVGREQRMHGDRVPGCVHAPERVKTHDVGVRETIASCAGFGASSSILVHQNECDQPEKSNVGCSLGDGDTHGESPVGAQPFGGASTGYQDGWELYDNHIGDEENVSGESEKIKQNFNSGTMPLRPPPPVSDLGALPLPTDSALHRCPPPSHFMKAFVLSLRCWFLCPLVVILITVAVITITLAVVTSKSSSESLSHTLHDVVLATMEASIGHLTLYKLAHMVEATGNLYFSTNTFPNPQTDVLIPLEDGMMSRLCAVLRDMDPSDTVSSLGAVSLTRQQVAFCVTSRSRPGAFLGAVSRNGTIDGFYYVDPVTLEFYTPLESPYKFDKPITIDEFTETQRYGTVVNIWKETLHKGEDMKPAQYWVTPRNPPTNAAFVYPFFEVYSNGSTGIGYMYGTMFTDDLKSVKWYDATDSGMRVMLVDPNATAERLLVLTNNWGQPLSNVSNAWLAVVRGEPVDFMHVDVVDDTLMREALKHVDLRAAIGNTQGQTASFPYGGFDARVTAKLLVTESGVEFLLVVVTSRSYYLGPVSVHGDIGIAAGVVALLLVTAACIAFVECCIMGPLRATQGELKLALTGAPVVAGNHPRAVLREVRELEDVCNTLRRRLDKVRSYMPDRLGAELVPTESYTAFGESDASNAGSHGRVSDKLKRVVCSVAYVYYTPRTTRNPTSAVMELIMRAVVEIATDCGGCFEVQRPDYCVISFGVRSRNKEFAAEAFQAVEFARRLREMMTACAELTGLYRVIVESGAFLSGVVSGGGHSHFVLLCRNLHYRIGEFLPYAGVVASVTEETALLVRGRCRLLPFETVFLEATGEAYVRLHEVIGGDVGTTAWHDYEHCYSEAYDMMERGEYASALRWWDRAKAVERGGLAGEPPECRSSQVERLREECVARVGRGDTTPFARRPRQARTEENEMPPSDAVSTVTGRDSVSAKIASSAASLFHDSSTSSPVSETASLEVISGCLPLQFKDHAGNVWKRSLEPMGGTATDITPVYMAISATGTLAVLKVCPLTNACALLSRAGMDAALEELLGLGVNDSLVQYLSYCIVPSQSVVLVTQYVPGGTLGEMKGRYGRKLPLPTVRRNVASMLRGLAHLHGRGLVHGRLCPENVMVGVDGRCRLKGMLLGVAPLIVHHESYYMSPEVAAGGVNTAENDMYALGLLLLAMLTDSHPWQWTANVQLDPTRAELDSLLADNTKFREALRNGLIEPVHPPVGVDDTMQDVLHACLCVNPEDRYSAFRILEIWAAEILHGEYAAFGDVAAKDIAVLLHAIFNTPCGDGGIDSEGVGVVSLHDIQFCDNPTSTTLFLNAKRVLSLVQTLSSSASDNSGQGNVTAGGGRFLAPPAVGNMSVSAWMEGKAFVEELKMWRWIRAEAFRRGLEMKELKSRVQKFFRGAADSRCAPPQLSSRVATTGSTRKECVLAASISNPSTDVCKEGTGAIRKRSREDKKEEAKCVSSAVPVSSDGGGGCGGTDSEVAHVAMQHCVEVQREAKAEALPLPHMTCDGVTVAPKLLDVLEEVKKELRERRAMAEDAAAAAPVSSNSSNGGGSGGLTATNKTTPCGSESHVADETYAGGMLPINCSVCPAVFTEALRQNYNAIERLEATRKMVVAACLKRDTADLLEALAFI